MDLRRSQGSRHKRREYLSIGTKVLPGMGLKEKRVMSRTFLIHGIRRAAQGVPFAGGPWGCRCVTSAIRFGLSAMFIALAVVSPVYAVTIQLPSESFGNVVQFDVPNCGAVACGPTAAVNSFVFLENQYPTIYERSLVPDTNGNGRRDYSEMVATAATLSGSQYMNTTFPSGTFSDKFITGGAAWVESQAPGRSVYTAGFPTVSVLATELANVKASNSLIGFYNDQGMRTGGHYITLTGLSWTDVNQDKVVQRSEGATVAFIDPGSGKNTISSLYQLGTGGILQLGYGGGARIELGVSVSPSLIQLDSNPVGNTISIPSGATERFSLGLDNRGTVQVNNNATFVLEAFPGTTGPLPVAATNTGVVLNEGTIRVAEGTIFTNGVSHDFAEGLYSNQPSATTQVDGRFQVTGGQVSNSGVITVGTRGEYFQYGGTTSNSGTFINAGQVRIGEGTSFTNLPRLEPGSQPSVVGGHYVQQRGGRTLIDGSFSSFGGRVTNEGAITVGATGTYGQTRSGAGVGATPTTVNSGTFTNAGNTVINAGTFTNHGSVVNNGTFQVAVNGAATLTNQGSMVNAGRFEVGTLGQVTGSGSYVQTAAAAQTIVNGTFAHNISLQAGTLSGTGTIQGTVQNSGGLLLPGNNGLGMLTIKGQYAQGFGGTFGVNLAGLSQGVTYGLLAVQGTGAAVTLGGSLKVGLLNGFSPSLGNTFGILTCTGCTISGGLRNLSLPTLASGLDWSVRFVDGLGTLQLAVVSTPIPGSGAPEPGTLLLVGAGFVGLVGWRRKQTRGCSAQRAAL